MKQICIGVRHRVLHKSEPSLRPWRVARERLWDRETTEWCALSGVLPGALSLEERALELEERSAQLQERLLAAELLDRLSELQLESSLPNLRELAITRLVHQ